MAKMPTFKIEIEGLEEFKRVIEIVSTLFKEEEEWCFGSEHRKKLWEEMYGLLSQFAIGEGKENILANEAYLENQILKKYESTVIEREVEVFPPAASKGCYEITGYTDSPEVVFDVKMQHTVDCDYGYGRGKCTCSV